MAEAAMRTASADVVYVRKDVSEAHMQRIDQRFDTMQMLMEKTLAEIKADNEKLRVDFNSVPIGRLCPKLIVHQTPRAATYAVNSAASFHISPPPLLFPRETKTTGGLMPPAHCFSAA